MAKILTLDTTTSACSVALCVEGQRYCAFNLEPQSHTRLIISMIDKVMAQASITVQQLDVIAFTHGPGSFTGIRIGFGVVQGLAFGLGIPVVTISSLALMAMTATRKLTLSGGEVVVPLLDARMGEVYLGEYLFDGNRVKTLSPDRLVSIEEVVPGRGFGTHGATIKVGDGWGLQEIAVKNGEGAIMEFYPDAQDLIDIALAEYSAGNHSAIQDVQPLYLRNRVSWQKRKRLRA